MFSYSWNLCSKSLLSSSIYVQHILNCSSFLDYFRGFCLSLIKKNIWKELLSNDYYYDYFIYDSIVILTCPHWWLEHWPTSSLVADLFPKPRSRPQWKKIQEASIIYSYFICLSLSACLPGIDDSKLKKTYINDFIQILPIQVPRDNVALLFLS